MSFRKGSIHLVKRVVANKAIKEGKAVTVERPVRPNALR